MDGKCPFCWNRKIVGVGPSGVVRYPTLCQADNTQGKLRPGMTATVTIHVGEVRGVPVGRGGI